MLSLNKLKNIEITAVPAEVQATSVEIESMPIVDIISDEDSIQFEEEEPAIDWYIPKRSYKQYFADMQSGKVSGHWDEEINALETFFKTNKLPASIDNITDTALFVSSHLATVKNNNGNRYFEPYMERLRSLKITIMNVVVADYDKEVSAVIVHR